MLNPGTRLETVPALPGGVGPPVTLLVPPLEAAPPQIPWEWPCWLAFGPSCYERDPHAVWLSYAGRRGGGGGGGGDEEVGGGE